MAAVTTDIISDTTGFENPHISTTAEETSAAQVVGSLFPADEPTAPVHQEQLVAEETTQTSVDTRTQVEYVAPVPAASFVALDSGVLDGFQQALVSIGATALNPLTKNLLENHQKLYDLSKAQLGRLLESEACVCTATRKQHDDEGVDGVRDVHSLPGAAWNYWAHIPEGSRVHTHGVTSPYSGWAQGLLCRQPDFSPAVQAQGAGESMF